MDATRRVPSFGQNRCDDCRPPEERLLNDEVGRLIQSNRTRQPVLLPLLLL